MAYTVVGLFDNKADARAAMDELVQNGFAADDIDFSEGRVGDTINTSTTSSTGTTNIGTGVGDSISNFFGYLFGDDRTTAQNYTEVARSADAILTVQVDSQDRANKVAEIFDRNNALDVDDRAAQYQQSYTQTSDRTQRAGTTEGEAVIPVVEEQMQVGKRPVEGGGVRVRSRVIEKPIEETLRLRQERVIVDRRPVNREATEADFANVREGDFEITERGEEAVVSKQPRVVEEVAVGKQVEERDQVVSDTVRRTEVDVEEVDNTNARRADNRT